MNNIYSESKQTLTCAKSIIHTALSYMDLVCNSESCLFVCLFVCLCLFIYQCLVCFRSWFCNY